LWIFGLIAAVGSGSAPVQAGLRTQVGEAVIENLQIGQSYSLKELANLNLIVMSTEDEEVDLQMDVLPPEPVELRLEAEVIPDISWVTLTPDFFTLSAGGQAEAEIRLAIPDDPSYLGRKFQFTIWSHTIPRGGGMFLAYGLKTRIIFTIDPEPPSGADAGTAEAASVEFALVPEEIHLERVTPGEVFDVAAEDGRSLEITNHGSEPQTLQLRSRKVHGSLATLTPGYRDAPDASFLRFSEDEITVAPGETRTVKLFVEFPPDRKYSGHQYMFVIHGTTAGERVTTGVYSRLYAALE
jgi:hypothetical protein